MAKARSARPLPYGIISVALGILGGILLLGLVYIAPVAVDRSADSDGMKVIVYALLIVNYLLFGAGGIFGFLSWKIERAPIGWPIVGCFLSIMGIFSLLTIG